MEYINLSTPTIVAKWFQTTPHNIRKTYKNKKPRIYELQCVAVFVMEQNITAEELVLAVELVKRIKG